MKKCIIIGGSGYIGSKLWQRMVQNKQFDSIVLADIKKPLFPLPEGVTFVEWDSREPASSPHFQGADWIINLAAVHREPGHEFKEYFDTNIPNAVNVCQLAANIVCKNIFFMSSIAVYGPCLQPTSEFSPKYPATGYGISKLLAEKTHEVWQASQPDRRLIICRPGVVYGPGDPGNILRMIRAVQKGLFFFPGKTHIYKSYAYIEGLLDSFEFTLKRPEPLIHYNYVETPTEPLNVLVNKIEAAIQRKTRTLALPLFFLFPIAHLIQVLSRGRSGIHPQRVRKAATPTNIVPQVLRDMNFNFRYNFEQSLKDWMDKAPEDFGSE